MCEKIVVSDELAAAALYFMNAHVNPLILHAADLQKVANSKNIGGRVRIIPWPHIAEYTALLHKIIHAKNKQEIRLDLLAAKPQVIRRLVINSFLPFWQAAYLSSKGLSESDPMKIALQNLHFKVSAPPDRLRQPALELLEKLMQIRPDASLAYELHDLRWPPKEIDANVEPLTLS